MRTLLSLVALLTLALAVVGCGSDSAQAPPNGGKQQPKIPGGKSGATNNSNNGEPVTAQ